MCLEITLSDIKNSINKTKIYQTIDFPDFSIKGERKSPELRLQFFDKLRLKNCKIIDIGCSNGFFSFHCAKKGANVIGYDKDENAIALNNKIASYYNLPAEFRSHFFDQEFFNSLEESDVVVFLSVIHHIFNHAFIDPVGKCRDVINAISKKTNCLIFEMGEPGEPFKWSEKMNIMDNNPKEWILKNLFEGSDFKHVDVFQAPIFSAGVKGKLIRKVVDMSRKGSLNPNKAFANFLAKTAYKLLVKDPRDTRHIFIAYKENCYKNG